ncbi:MAG: hypothetical protein MR467_06620, partial [Bacillales bacterium]|nr:hypothetical protein [Bacillales bacterium]
LSQNTKLKKVALILESPHKDEFDIYYRPLLPANGLTGKKIYEKLGSKMNNKALLNRSFVYEIYIINPVQYQCSLYHELEIKDFGAHIYGATTHCRKLTNKVFRCLFGSAKHPTDIQLDFQARLCTYNPDIILNCCTYGLKKLVDGAIHSKTILLDHPSRW